MEQKRESRNRSTHIWKLISDKEDGEKTSHRRTLKTFTKHISNKELVSRIYKELSKCNDKKTTQLQNGQKI